MKEGERHGIWEMQRPADDIIPESQFKIDYDNGKTIRVYDYENKKHEQINCETQLNMEFVKPTNSQELKES